MLSFSYFRIVASLAGAARAATTKSENTMSTFILTNSLGFYTFEINNKFLWGADMSLLGTLKLNCLIKSIWYEFIYRELFVLFFYYFIYLGAKKKQHPNVSFLRIKIQIYFTTTETSPSYTLSSKLVFSGLSESLLIYTTKKQEKSFLHILKIFLIMVFFWNSK